MASISTLGVGSGLDLSGILDSLEAAQKSTLKPISTQQSSYTAKLSAYGTLKSALETFQTANTALNKADLFTATSTTSSSTRLQRHHHRERDCREIHHQHHATGAGANADHQKQPDRHQNRHCQQR